MMNAKDNFLKVKHLYNRAGFGISYTDLQKLSKKKLNKAVDGLFKAPDKDEALALVDSSESKRQLLFQAGL
jgi:hypothetical protein